MCASITSLFMILGWMVGDVYKSAYVFLTDAPLQFLMCGVFQACTDAYILLQMFVLYNPKSCSWRAKKTDEPTSPVRSDPSV